MSSLLPKTSDGFTEKKYWKEFFRIRGESPFEWYGDYNELGPVLERYLKVNDQVLHVGCGNSELGEQLYDNGFRNIVNLDIVGEVIEKKKAKNSQIRPELIWKCSDATKTEFPSEHFSVILDKGTLDALLPSETESTETVVKLFSEMDRLLTPGMGRYVTVTLAQPHIVRAWTNHFSRLSGYLLRAHQCSFGSQGSFKLPTFLLIATKFKPGLPLPMAFEYCSGTIKKSQRMSDLEEFRGKLAASQEYFAFSHHCRTK